MCRVVVATRRLAPEREYAVFRALQFAQFTTTLFLEDSASCVTRSPGCPGSTPTRSSPRRTTPRPRSSSRRTATRPAPPRVPDRVPGQARQHRRPRALHGAEHPVHQPAGHDARGGRLPDLRGLRRDDRQPRPASPAARRRGRGRGPGGVPGRADDRRGRADHGRGQVPARPRPGRGRADHGGRTAATRRVQFGHDALWVPSAPAPPRPNSPPLPRKAAPDSRDSSSTA